MTEEAIKKEKVTVIVCDLEGNKKTKHCASIAHARKFAIEQLGEDFVIRERYAESTTVDRLVMVKNATLQELLVDELPAGSSNAGTGKGKVKRAACRNEIMGLIGIYVSDPKECEDLMAQIEDEFVVYRKQVKSEDGEPEAA